MRQKPMATSNVFGWQYQLDATAPAITTRDEMNAMADAYNHTVSIELVQGTMMLVEQMEKKQVATFGGALDEWARAAYPSPSLIAKMEQSGEIEGYKAELTGLLADVAAGSTMANALTARRAVREAKGLTKRDCGGCPIIIWSCPLMPGCGGACILIFCTSGS